MLTLFGYYASSICITVVLAAFLAILFDPLVVRLEKFRLPRGVAAAVVVLGAMGVVGLLGQQLYGRALAFAEELPVYTSKIQQTLEPISRKIQKVQQSAGNLTNDVQPSKKVPEVRLQESRAWPAYLVRGAGSVWGVLIIAVVVPFLAFFMLCSKNQTVTRVDALFGSKIDTARFVTNLNEMIRGFVAGNLIVGSMMAVATTLMLLGIGMKGAIPLGNRQRSLKSTAVPRTNLFARASPGSGHPAVQYSGTICHHHSDNPPVASRVCESSYSKIYRDSRKYRAGGGDGWDSLLGLVVGCDGLAAGCAAHGIRQAHRGFAPVPKSLIQRARTRASSDSTLAAIRRNGVGPGDSLLARPPGSQTRRKRFTG